MGRKQRPFLLMVGLCSTAGVILGGTSSWAESNRCAQADSPTIECLSKNPVNQAIEGMSVGLVAGISAAVSATLYAKQGLKAK
ncbi:MAG TPA: hypothetical protein V6D18_13465 [Thermosynechococcaceae cyanobacterium]